MGLNYSLTGVFYNKKLAQQIGMTEPPKTVAEFEALLAKAKAADLLPIMVWNAATSGGGLAFPLQQLMAAYGPTQPINDWIFQKPGRIDRHADQPHRRPASRAVDQGGYFPKDANAIEYTDANARFGKGEGVFMFNGDWQNGGYDKDLPGQRRLLRVPAGRGRRIAGRHVGTADLRHREERQERRLRGVLLQLGRHERQGTRDQRAGRSAPTPAVRRICRSRRSQPGR